jgi:hypothetical protein
MHARSEADSEEQQRASFRRLIGSPCLRARSVQLLAAFESANADGVRFDAVAGLPSSCSRCLLPIAV